MYTRECGENRSVIDLVLINEYGNMKIERMDIDEDREIRHVRPLNAGAHMNNEYKKEYKEK